MIMTIFEFGQYVRPSNEALDNGVIRSGEIGIVVFDDGGQLIRVHRKGKKTSEWYHRKFWRENYR